MKKIAIFIFFVFITGVCLAQAHAATYYIDYVNGSDTNAGTKTSPWQHAPGMNVYVNGYWKPLVIPNYTHQPGDRFIFKGGVTWPSSVLPLTISFSGALGNQDEYTVDKTWYSGTTWSNPILDGGMMSVGEAIYASHQSNFIIDSFQIQNVGNPISTVWLGNNNYAASVYVRPTAANDNGLYYQNVTTANGGPVSCVSASSEPAWPSATESTVNDGTCVWSRQQSSGSGNAIYFDGGSNIEVKNNILQPGALQAFAYGVDGNNESNISFHDNQISLAGRVVIYGEPPYLLNGVQIYNNRYAGSGNMFLGDYHQDGFMLGIPSHPANPPVAIENVSFYNNYFYGDWSAGATAQFYSLGGLSGVSMYNNVFAFENNCYGTAACPSSLGTFLSPSFVYFQNDANINVYNNTFSGDALHGYDTSQTPALILGVVSGLEIGTPTSGTSINIEGNIFSNMQIGLNLDTSTNAVYNIDYNLYNPATEKFGDLLYYGPTQYKTLSAVQSLGFETHGQFGVPEFVSIPNGTVGSGNWNLQSDSPALGAGINLSSNFTADINGNARPASGNWTIGAYQYPQTFYVYCGATGAANGTDWTDAYTKLPASLNRGDTYVIAGSNSCTYPSHAFNDAENSTSVITIRKAESSLDSGVSGWQSTFATAQAVWNDPIQTDPQTFSSNLPLWGFCQGYYSIDGITGSTNSYNPGGQGFLIQSPAPSYSGLVRISNNSGSCGSSELTTKVFNNISIHHVELSGVQNYYQVPVTACSYNSSTGIATITTNTPGWQQGWVNGDIVSGFDGSSMENKITNTALTLVGTNSFTVSTSPNPCIIQVTPKSGYSGTGYQVNDVLNVVQKGASGASVTVSSVGSGGTVTGVTLNTSGSEYTTSDGLATTGGHGSGADVFWITPLAYVVLEPEDGKGVGSAGFYATGPNNSYNNLDISYNYIHTNGPDNFDLMNATNVTVDHNYFTGNQSNHQAHGQSMQVQSVNGLTVSNNSFADVTGTAILFNSALSTPTNSYNWNFYGNLVFETGTNPYAGVSALITDNCGDGGDSGIIGMNVFNNTIANLNSIIDVDAGLVAEGFPNSQCSSGWVVENNLWWNSVKAAVWNIDSTSSHNNNTFLNTPIAYLTVKASGEYCSNGTSSAPSTSCVNTTSSNPFLSSTGNYVSNFHLSNPMGNSYLTSGTILGSPYTTDLDGNTRGPASGNWDIGAYQYVSSSTVPPTLNFTSPDFNASYTAPANITFTANASANATNATISRVSFYNGPTLLQTVSSSPYTYTWTNVLAGAYSLTALATDSNNNTTASVPVSVTVGPSSSILYGDVIGTGHVTIYDAELTAQYAIGLTVPSFIPYNAKVDGNSTVDIYDAYLIAEYAIGLISKFSAVQQ